MSLSLSSLKSNRDWSASTSLKKVHFYNLLPYFAKGYEQIYGLSIEEIQANKHQEFVFSTYESFLFFMLFLLKNPTTYDVNGLIFGISQSAAETNFKRGLVVLKKALELSNQLPLQEFESQTALIEYIKKHKCLKIDITEINVERPKNKESQKKHYSGKKKDTPVKH